MVRLIYNRLHSTDQMEYKSVDEAINSAYYSEEYGMIFAVKIIDEDGSDVMGEKELREVLAESTTRKDDEEEMDPQLMTKAEKAHELNLKNKTPENVRFRIVCFQCKLELQPRYTHNNQMGDILVEVDPCKNCGDTTFYADYQMQIKKLKTRIREMETAIVSLSTGITGLCSDTISKMILNIKSKGD